MVRKLNVQNIRNQFSSSGRIKKTLKQKNTFGLQALKTSVQMELFSKPEQGIERVGRVKKYPLIFICLLSAATSPLIIPQFISAL